MWLDFVIFNHQRRSIYAPPLFDQSSQPYSHAKRNKHRKYYFDSVEVRRCFFFLLTYGVKTLTHLGDFPLRLYSKQNAIDSSSLSHRLMVSHSKSTICVSSVPSSWHAINWNRFIPVKIHKKNWLLVRTVSEQNKTCADKKGFVMLWEWDCYMLFSNQEAN